MIDTKELRIYQRQLNETEDERDTLRAELNEIRYGVAVAHDTIKALRARIEEAEKEVAHIKEVEFPRKARAVAVGWETKCARLEQERTIDEQRIADLMEELNRVGHENDTLRAKIEAMDNQEPVAWAFRKSLVQKLQWHKPVGGENVLRHWVPLYTLPGAKGD